MYYPGCLAFTTAILNIQKEMNYDGTDEQARLRFSAPDEELTSKINLMFIKQMIKKCYKTH